MAHGKSPTTVVAGILILCSPVGTAQVDPPAGRASQPSGIVVPAPTGRPARRHDETSLLVRFEPSASQDQHARARAQINGTRLRVYSSVPGLELVRVTGQPVEQAIATLRRLPFVAYAHRNPVIYIDQQLPDDEFFAEQWPLHNTGQASGFGVWPAGTPDADIDWPEAWAGVTGGGAVVAIIDTGIEYRHADLAPGVWLNAAEEGGITGVDDDGNGYVDDIRGWDFVNGDNRPLDDHGHGSHVAGIVAAAVNNGLGVAGVMWNGKVMALKVLDETGYGLLSDAIAALEYATANGARVSNASWGYSEILPEELNDHLALYDAIAAAVNHLVVAAAGNDTADTDATPHYPSAFDLDNVIAVTATDNNDQMAWFANWGASTVDLAAPGQDVFSTYKRFAVFDDYAWLSGTSMAAPHVSGVAGLLAALPACQTYAQVRDQILGHVRPVGALAGLTVTGGVLNMQDTLNGSECAPAVPSLAVDTTLLPEARRFGAGYEAELTASGGVAPYAWSLAGGALPAGLSLSENGWITGVATAPSASYAFTVQVTDDAGTTASRALSIFVATSPCGSCHQGGR